MAVDRQQQGDIRISALLPEAVLPQPIARDTPWGPLLVGLLIVVTAGIALAWAWGLFEPREAEPVDPALSATVLAPPPRSPYPTDLTNLSGQRALPPTPPPPAPIAEPIPVPAPKPEPVVVIPPPPTPTPMPMPVPHIERLKIVPMSAATVAPRVPVMPKPFAHAAVSPVRPILRKLAVVRMAQPLGGPLAGVFVPGDYPAAARRNGERGDVTVRLTVGRDGRANGCRILAADASATLKSATCAILIARARFVPATDTSGAQSEGFFVQHVAWQLP